MTSKRKITPLFIVGTFAFFLLASIIINPILDRDGISHSLLRGLVFGGVTALLCMSFFRIIYAVGKKRGWIDPNAKLPFDG